MVGSNLFNSSRANPFKRANTNHRHYSFSLLEVSQAYKEIQKTIFNEKEVEAIFEEYPMGLKKEVWHKAYEHCVDGAHNFMFYDITKKPLMRIMKNFSEYVYSHNTEEE